MNFKEVLKNKKVIIPVLLVAIVAVGTIIGLNLGKESVKINPEKIQGLIETDYNANITAESETAVDLTVTGKLTDEEMKDLVSKLFTTGTNWGKDEVILNFFNAEADVKTIDKFYVEGLNAQVKLDYTTNTAKIGTFESVPKVDKAKNLVDYNKGEIGYTDKNVLIKLDMAVKGESIDVVAQAKAFTVMFRDVNTDKEISTVQLDINHNVDKGYSYHSEFEDILKNIETVHY